VMLYLIAPELYTGKNVGLRVNTEAQSEEHGRLIECEDRQHSVYLVEKISDPDAAFQLIVEAIQRAIKV